jgi:D-2-hydroxyacid dehydrogenase (NADP+)
MEPDTSRLTALADAADIRAAALGRRLVKLLIILYHRFGQWQAPQWFAERLRSEFSLEVVQLSDYERVSAGIAEADIAIAWSLRGEQVQCARKLRWIHSTATAVHALISPELQASDIVVTNARSVHGPVVAEHTLALAYALARRLPQAVRYQQRKHWAQQDIGNGRLRPRELSGATMTIVGLGGIGRPLAKLARCVGMRVLAVREHPEQACEDVDGMYGLEQIDEALGEAEFVVLAVPVTSRTHHLMNGHRLAQMKEGAYLINVGRGVLIDEPALVEALRRNSIAGAALDVTTVEPLPGDSPLWEMENVLLTPHIAGLTDRMWERHYAAFTENLRRFLKNEPLLWVVDKQAGY